MLNYMIVLQAHLNDVDYLQISEYFLYLLKVDIQEASGDNPDGADTNPPPCWLTGHTHTHTHLDKSEAHKALTAVAETALSLQYEQ